MGYLMASEEANLFAYSRKVLSYYVSPRRNITLGDY